MNGLLGFLQSASNTAANTVSGPVDLIAAGLRKVGVPVPEDPVAGANWMKHHGLLRDVPNGPAKVLGETAGMLTPALAMQYAPQIASVANKAISNAMAPQSLNKQQGVIGLGKNLPPAWSDDFADIGGKLNSDGTVTVYHRTSKEAADSIRNSGVMRGAEDGVFFSSSPTGAATGFGDELVELRIPASKLELDDLFNSEAHFRLPTRKAGQPVFVKEWLKK